MIDDICRGPQGPQGPQGASGAQGPIGGSTQIWWRLDGTGDATTWAQVMVLVAAAKAPATIWVSEAGPYNIPAGGPYELHGSTIAAPANVGTAVIQPDVELADGASLQNLGAIAGPVYLNCSPSAADAFVYTTVQTLRISGLNANLNNSGSHAIFTVAGTTEFRLYLMEYAQIGGSHAVFDVTAASTLTVVVEEGAIIPSDWATSSDTTGLLNYASDGTLLSQLPITTIGLTVGNTPLGQLGLSGATSFRPTLPNGSSKGVMYFDTTLSPPIPIWWDGTQWVNASGAAV